MGDANYISIRDKIAAEIGRRDDTVDAFQTIVDEIVPIIATQSGMHTVMTKFVRYMRSTYDSFKHSLCALPQKDSLRTPTFGMWLHTCFKKDLISKQEYETHWTELMKAYESVTKEMKSTWANVFEQALKDSLDDDWWHPRLTRILNDPDTPMSLCFKIEDYLED